MQANGFNAAWPLRNGQGQQQGQSQTHGQATIIGQDGSGQGRWWPSRAKNQRWASLTSPQQQLPQQKQPQAFRNGQQGGAAFTKLAPQQRQNLNGGQQQQAGTQRQSFAPQSGGFTFQPQQQQRQPQLKQRSKSAGTGNKPLLPQNLKQPGGN